MFPVGLASSYSDCCFIVSKIILWTDEINCSWLNPFPRCYVQHGPKRHSLPQWAYSVFLEKKKKKKKIYLPEMMLTRQRKVFLIRLSSQCSHYHCCNYFEMNNGRHQAWSRQDHSSQHLLYRPTFAHCLTI